MRHQELSDEQHDLAIAAEIALREAGWLSEEWRELFYHGHSVSPQVFGEKYTEDSRGVIEIYLDRSMMRFIFYAYNSTKLIERDIYINITNIEKYILKITQGFDISAA